MKDNVINLINYIENNQRISPTEPQKQLKSKSILQKRIYSYIVDLAIVFTLKAAIDVSFIGFISNFLFFLDAGTKKALLNAPIYVHAPIFLSIFTGYFLVSGILINGHTIGQKVFGLKVLSDNEKHISFSTNLKRTAGFLSYYLGFGLFQLFYFMNEDKKSFVDLISKTIVVDSASHVESDDAEVITIDIDRLDQAA
ncbi:MAG: RDD family protein [Bacteriovoracaceae bacterium]|jgi:uncharacterized RDD family membrane protein YckC|nr:RDD family protein [Bacteriovoracaceae bacterium]